MVLIAFRHGLRASELCELQWSDVEFETGNLHLRRAKRGATGTHPLLGDELRALRALKREAKSHFIFVSERDAPFSVSGLAKLIERAGVQAKIPFPIHAHMLRHACGYALANKGPRPSRSAALVQTTYGRMAHVVGPCNFRKHFACVSSSNSLASLMRRQLGLATEDNASRLCSRATFAGSCPNKFSLELSQT